MAWFFLKEIGFLSVVHKQPCNKDELLVRTRCKVDIQKLQKLLKTKYQFDGEVIETPKADYPYRMVVPREIFASFMANVTKNIDYDNFKNTVPRIDYKRHEAYFRCWNALYEWERDLERAKE